MRRSICAAVATVGLVTLGLELLANRVLSPYFGSSIFTWGNLLGVVLFGLAIGYAWGGWLADRPGGPSRIYFPVFVACVVMIAGLPALSRRLCPQIAEWPGPANLQSLYASLLLFLFPFLALGAFFPIAVKLSTRALSRTGSVVGVLGAISTLGGLLGVAGCLALLELPEMGVSRILYLLATLLALAGIPLASSTRGRTAALALGALIWGLSPAFTGLARIPDANGLQGELLAEVESPYSSFQVRDQGSGKETRRILSFTRGHAHQSAIFPRLPDQPNAAAYHRLFWLAWAIRPEIREVALLGGGGGVFARDLLRSLPAKGTGVERVEVVDPDPRMFDAARRFFGYPRDDGRLTSHVSDGRVFIQRSERSYDLIVVDSFAERVGMPEHMITREFFRGVRRRLKPGGVMALNLTARAEIPGEGARESRPDPRYLSFLKTIASEFGLSHVSTVTLGAPGQRGSLVFLAERAEEGESDPAKPVSAAFRRGLYEPARLAGFAREFASAAVFTDDSHPTRTAY